MGEDTNIPVQSNEPVETLKVISTSSTSDNITQALWGINTKRPSCFEEIDFLSWIDKKKLEELQQADLVLVYRDNDRYRAMSDALKDLVEQKYWWKVYCVLIPQGKEELNDNEMELLKNILNTCHCMTDDTIDKWTWISCPKFEDCGNYYENSKKFLWIIENLEMKFKEKWIDTVYVYMSSIDHTGEVMYTCFDHWSMCERENWSIYFDPISIRPWLNDEEIKEKIDNLKRFWKSRFPNLNVNFIENLHISYGWFNFSRYESEWIIFDYNGEYSPESAVQNIKAKHDPDFDINFYIWHGLTESNGYKYKWSVLIADRHAEPSIKQFQGEKILYEWNNFSPNKGIEKFLNEKDAQYVQNAGHALAESILLNPSFTLEDFNFKIEVEK